MGTTIGINTMILMASLIFIRENYPRHENTIKVSAGFWICNISLLIFWLSLLVAGFIKSIYQGQLTHQDILSRQIPWFFTIAISGFLFLIGMILIIKSVVKVRSKE